MGNDSLDRSFGLVIAFLIPGFICLGAASRFSPTIAGWMSIAPTTDPTVGGFLYVILASIGAGLVASAIRWLVIDTIHHRMGLRQPDWDFGRLQENLEAFRTAVEHNYKHYLFYGNTAVACLAFCICDQLARGVWPLWAHLLTLVLEGILLATSRDCLRRYYRRTEQLLAHPQGKLIDVSRGR
jgi:hypothetical protein